MVSLKRDNLLFLAADYPGLCDLRRILEHDLSEKCTLFDNDAP
jgi:hypothetical protein